MKKQNPKSTFTLQQDQSDCGVACLLSIIKYHEGDYSLDQLRNISGTTKEGTTMLGLVQSGVKCGLQIDGFKAEIKHLKEQKEPVIIHVLIDGRLQHYLVVYKYENNRFTVGNPAKGIVYYNEEELEGIWQSKSLLTLSPNNDFVKRENAKNRKKKYLLSLLKDDYPLLTISLVFGVILAGLNMVMALYSEKLIDEILPQKEFTRFIVGTSLVGFLLVVRALFVGLRQRILIEQSKNFNIRIINKFYGKLLSLPKVFFDTRRIGELISRLNDTARIQSVISQLAGNMIIDILISIISLIVLFSYSVETGLITSAIIPLVFIVLYRYNKPVIEGQKEVMTNYAHSESNYIDNIQAISEIKNSDKQKLFSETNSKIYSQYQNSVFNLGKINVKLIVNSGVLSALFLMIILGYNSYEVFNDRLQTGEMMAIIGIASSMLPSITNLALVSIVVNEAKVAFYRMFEFVDIDAEKEDGQKIEEKISSIKIDNLSFRFPGKKLLLDKVNLEASLGKMVFIMGESGSGKSTLAQIMQRYYLQESGKVLINNKIELKDLKLNNWRNKLAVIPQEIPILSGSVLFNIAMDNNEETLKEALTFLNENGFASFIDSLPQGYMTLIGENGINLSGGQKQMIALARALFQKPDLLIIDEGTSAMDYFTEHVVLQKLLKFKENGIVIFITHRSNLPEKYADKIYKLEEKKLIEFEDYYVYDEHQKKAFQKSKLAINH